MAGYNYDSHTQLQDLRAWRALVAEMRGTIRSLESFRFALGLPLEDALSAFGLANSEWARERWLQLRSALDAPVEVPGAEPELDTAA